MSIAREIVGFAMEAGSSDIHLEEQSPIAVRVNSDIKVSPQNLESEDMDQLLLELLGEEKLNEFNQTGDLDSSIGLEGLSRLRINAYVANEKRCLTLRLLPNDLPKWQDLGLPNSFILSRYQSVDLGLPFAAFTTDCINLLCAILTPTV